MLASETENSGDIIFGEGLGGGHGATPHRPREELILPLNPEIAPPVSQKTGPGSGRKRPLAKSPLSSHIRS